MIKYIFKIFSQSLTLISGIKVLSQVGQCKKGSKLVSTYSTDFNPGDGLSSGIHVDPFLSLPFSNSKRVLKMYDICCVHMGHMWPPLVQTIQISCSATASLLLKWSCSKTEIYFWPVTTWCQSQGRTKAASGDHAFIKMYSFTTKIAPRRTSEYLKSFILQFLPHKIVRAWPWIGTLIKLYQHTLFLK